MLKRLYIENVAIIEKVEIEFFDGLCVLSGETGAGKSIIIDSINALCGGRVSRDLIRTGANSAVVSAVFDNVPESVRLEAQQMGLSADNGLLLRREMYLSGHNACHINGQPAALSMLRQLGTKLINIHGQHDGLYLLDENLHIDYLHTVSAQLLSKQTTAPVHADKVGLNTDYELRSFSLLSLLEHSPE